MNKELAKVYCAKCNHYHGVFDTFEKTPTDLQSSFPVCPQCGSSDLLVKHPIAKAFDNLSSFEKFFPSLVAFGTPLLCLVMLCIGLIWPENQLGWGWIIGIIGILVLLFILNLRRFITNQLKWYYDRMNELQDR